MLLQMVMMMYKRVMVDGMFVDIICVVIAQLVQVMNLGVLLMEMVMLGSGCSRCYPHNSGVQIVRGF